MTDNVFIIIFEKGEKYFKRNKEQNEKQKQKRKRERNRKMNE